MGFLSGVITGVAVAAGAAAWYMSRSGSRVREQYQFEKRLGEIGDQMESRTRDIQAQVNAQLAEMRGKAEDNGLDMTASDTLDAATASAAEAAADVAAEAETTAGKAKKAAKDVADEAAG